MQEVKRKSTHQSSRVNVMQSISWMTVVSEAILVPGGIFAADDWYKIACFILAVIIVVFYGSMFVYFAVKDPDRLQSEEFNLAHHELTLLGDNREFRSVQIINSNPNENQIGQSIPISVSSGE